MYCSFLSLKMTSFVLFPQAPEPSINFSIYFNFLYQKSLVIIQMGQKLGSHLQFLFQSRHSLLPQPLTHIQVTCRRHQPLSMSSGRHIQCSSFRCFSLPLVLQTLGLRCGVVFLQTWQVKIHIVKYINIVITSLIIAFPSQCPNSEAGY